jgi:NADH-quinone oxidoreductase subunit E
MKGASVNSSEKSSSGTSGAHASVLTSAEIAAIEHEASHYEQKQGAAIEALKIAQKRSGWVSDEALVAVAELLEMTPAELDNVATFYSLIFRRPVGRHVVQMCDSVSCWILGCSRLFQELKDRHGLERGGTTRDGRLTLIPNACLGCCDKGPALMVGEDLHTHLTTERLREVLEKYE